MDTADQMKGTAETDSEVFPALEEQDADRAVQDIFGSEENARKTGGIVSKFVESYERQKNEKSIDVWLIDEFRQCAGIWKSDEELVASAKEIVEAVRVANEKKVSLYAHLDAGKSKESWLAKCVEQGAAASGVMDVGHYAAGIDQAIGQANRDMASAVLTGAGEINQLPNLDGFIAEQHHVATFNLDAASKGAHFQARVLTPEPGSAYGKNSMDIGVYDTRSGKLVGRYQAKYGKDAQTTLKYFEEGDYRGQKKLVPDGQAGGDGKTVDRLEIDGVESKPLSKEEAKALQESAQVTKEIKAYKWNDANRINIAKQIGTQALITAGWTAAMQGGRIVGRRVWNFITGKENPPASADMKEFFESSVKSAKNAGLQVAVSGGMVVAARNGWIKLLQHTPAGQIANIVYVGMENARVLYKFAKGEINGVETMNAMGNVTCSAVGGLMGAAKGATLGAGIGVALGPVGAFVGGTVGAIAGGVAGSMIGKKVYEGGKQIIKVAVSAVKTAWQRVKETVRSVAEIVIA